MIKNKKIIIFVFLFIFISSFLIKSSFSDDANTCNYTDKITKCLDEIKKWSPRAIEDFVCIDWTKEEVIFQIVFDEKFKEIDDEAEKYLQALEDNKDKYFWAKATLNYLDAVDEVVKKFSYYGEYWEKYNKLCWVNLITEVQSCQEWKSSTQNTSTFFEESECMNLANTKLYIYSQVSYDILMLNKSQVKKDSWKLYTQEERTKYDKLLNSMMINLWYMERISQKWPVKLKNPY